MKKKVFCAFVLVFWILAVCTFLSAKVQKLMTVSVTMVPSSQTRSVGSDTQIPADAVSYDETGSHLFSVQRMAGWQGGVWATEVDSSRYRFRSEQFVLVEQQYGNRFIQYSTKSLQSGDPIAVLTNDSKEDDLYLAAYPDGVPALKAQTGDMAVETQGQDVLLLSVKGAFQPFMEQRAVELVSAAEDLTEYEGSVFPNGAQKNVYSLLAVERFAQALPLLALLLVLLLLPAAAWAYSCALIQDTRKNRVPLLLNAAIMALSLIGLPLLLNAIELPSALMPSTNILDFGHYAGELSQIFHALDCLPSLPQSAQNVVHTVEQARLLALGIIGGGVLLAAGLMAAEHHMGRKRNRNEHPTP